MTAEIARYNFKFDDKPRKKNYYFQFYQDKFTYTTFNIYYNDTNILCKNITCLENDKKMIYIFEDI